MFTVDDSSIHVTATPAATAHLNALAAARGNVTVMLSDHGAAVLKSGEQPRAGSVLLGHLDDAGVISFVGEDTAAKDWWRSRAQIDLSDNLDMTYDLSELSEAELFAVLAAGPLLRY